MSRKNKLSYLKMALLGLFLFLGGSAMMTNYLNAQTIQPELVAAEVYQRLPTIPQENQYLSQETGEVALEHTLINRVVRYHQYVKSRPTNFRFDWQLTLADYLGANETIQASRYPGATTLGTNPLEGDKKAIATLNRRQRSELVDVLVSIYNPRAKQTPPPTQPEAPTPQPSPPTPIIPQPGDAELLKDG